MTRLVAASLPLLALLVMPAAARAADAHVAVQPDKGDIVLLRDVSTRTAYRPAPPGIALMADPTPNREIDQSLGTGEISDDEFASMSSGQVDAQGRTATVPQQMTERALQGSLGRMLGDDSALSGSGFTRSVGGATGAITGATRNIAPTITSALSQLPLGGSQGTGP